MTLIQQVVVVGMTACPVQNPVHRLSVSGHVNAPHRLKWYFRPGLVLSTGLRSHALSFHGFASLVVPLGFQLLHSDSVPAGEGSFVSGLFLLCFPLSVSWMVHPVDWAGVLYSAVAETV